MRQVCEEWYSRPCLLFSGIGRFLKACQLETKANETQNIRPFPNMKIVLCKSLTIYTQKAYEYLQSYTY